MDRYTLRIEKTLAHILGDQKEYSEANNHLHKCLALQEKLTNDIAQAQMQIIQYDKEARDSRFILEKRLQQTIHLISKIGEIRDVYTAGHQRRVRDLACAIAKEMNLSDISILNLSYGALIHDIGKIFIASEILNKPGKLSNIEFQILQTHSEQGYNVVKEVDFPDVIHTMIYQHHERLDGTGYPNGLSGDQIIIESRILAVADVVEAMSSHRPYRPALGIDVALEEIEKYKGIKFDEKVVDVCIQLFKEKGFSFDDESKKS
jgi:HD-GYP domain-containing protein (c-di-GMP phosphodiesterase class II)